MARGEGGLVMARAGIGTLLGLTLTLGGPADRALPAPACPDVESAKASLERAASRENSRALSERAARAPAPQRSEDAKAPKAQPDQQASNQAPKSSQAPAGAAPGGQNQDTAASPNPRTLQLSRAALLVKEADTACQAGKTTEAAEKASAAMSLLKD
jgi:hypothetical protein